MCRQSLAISMGGLLGATSVGMCNVPGWWEPVVLLLCKYYQEESIISNMIDREIDLTLIFDKGGQGSTRRAHIPGATLLGGYPLPFFGLLPQGSCTTFSL